MDEQTRKNLEQITESYRRLDAKIDQSRGENAERFDGIEQRLDRQDQRFDGIEQRLDGHDQRFDGIEQRLDGHDQRFDKMETEFRHTRILLEKLESNVQLVAEGVSTVNQKLDAFIDSVKQQRAQDRAEVQDGFRALKRRDQELDTRVTRLEATQARAGGA